MRKKSSKLLAILMILVMILTSISFSFADTGGTGGEVIEETEDLSGEDVEVTKYALILANIHTWTKLNGTYDTATPGESYTAMYSLPLTFKVDPDTFKVYSFDAEAYGRFTWDFDICGYNPIPNYLNGASSYRYNYEPLSITNDNSTVTAKNIKVTDGTDDKGQEISVVSYNIEINKVPPKENAYQLSKQMEAAYISGDTSFSSVKAFLGGTDSIDSETLKQMNAYVPGSSATGLVYFLPIILEYTEIDEHTENPNPFDPDKYTIDPTLEMQQVNVIEKANGEVEIQKVIPSITGNKVNLSPSVLASGVTEPVPLIDWVTSPVTYSCGDSDEEWSWDLIEAIRDGISGAKGGLAGEVPTLTEGTIYVHYKEPIAEITSAAIEAGDLYLSEKRISKVYDLNTIADAQGTSLLNVSNKISGYKGVCCEHSKPNGGLIKHRYRAKDRIFYNTLNNRTAVDTTKIADTGNFEATYKNNILKSSSVPTGGGSYSTTPNMNYVVYRGTDMPTLCSYANPGETVSLLNQLGITSGLTPLARKESGRYDTGVFEANISVDSSADKHDGHTSSTCNCWSPHTSTHSHNVSTATYKASTTMDTYVGDANVGNVKTTEQSGSVKIGGYTIEANKLKGYAINNTVPIKFYPYTQMSYDTNESNVNDSTKTKTANVLSPLVSTMSTNDYIEVGWLNTGTSPSLDIKSQQWSSFAAAVKAHGAGNVLPGGAIYALDDVGKSKVVVATWQTVLTNEQIQRTADSASASYYSSANAASRRNGLFNNIEKHLDNYDVVQYIYNGNGEGNKVFTDGIKLENKGGQNVYGNKTTNDAKYWLKRGTPQASATANEADLDVLSKNSSSTVYKVYSDVGGNVYITKNNTPLETLTKTQTIANLTNAEVLALDKRTALVSNFVASIDRNKGNDETLSDKAWYNEAWGDSTNCVQVIKTEYVYDLGFKTPTARTCALDPKLCPKSDSKGDIFKSYYSSAFRINSNCNLYPETDGKPSGYIGEVNGMAITVPNWEWVYKSKVFYIPNATVMDLDF